PRASADIENIGAYNADLNQRIARGAGAYKEWEEQIDLVIVVDRLLTGFDAPPLSTIFLDRPPMAPQHLIQAFSRTNRKFVPIKKYGQVVTLQYPAAYEKKIDEALLLYSHGGLAEVSAPTWEQILEKLKKAVVKLLEIAPTPQDAMKLPGEIELLTKFVSAYQQVDHLFSSIATYDAYDPNNIKDLVGIDLKELSKYTGHYQNRKEDLRKLLTNKSGGDPDLPPIEVDLGHELESIRLIEVNYSYLMQLIQAHVQDNLPDIPSKGIEEKIGKYLDNYKANHPEIGEIVEQLWFEIKMNPQDFVGKDITEEVQERIRDLQDTKMKEFAQEWHVSELALQATKEAWNGSDEVTINGNYDAYVAAGGTDSKLRYTRKLREAVNKLFIETIRPYSHF
ncbi:MAG: type I restriction endonuclease subunit R, partial [Burkholderiales bacterium]|nr:type I restriction endonuclease subunit R [Burkholderiales bacterium]